MPTRCSHQKIKTENTNEFRIDLEGKSIDASVSMHCVELVT